MNRRMKEALDKHITGNYGENQYPEPTDEEKKEIKKETNMERNREYYEPLDDAFHDFIMVHKENLEKEFLLINEQEFLDYCKDEFKRTL